MKFLNRARYGDLDRIAAARSAHFAYADGLREQGHPAIGGPLVDYVKYAGDAPKLAAVRPAHWDYDRTLKRAGTLALAGPFADDTGGLFVYHAGSREEAMAHAARDPFALEGVVAEGELLEWIVEGVAPKLLTSDFAPGAD